MHPLFSGLVGSTQQETAEEVDAVGKAVVGARVAAEVAEVGRQSIEVWRTAAGVAFEDADKFVALKVGVEDVDFVLLLQLMEVGFEDVGVAAGVQEAEELLHGCD